MSLFLSDTVIFSSLSKISGDEDVESFKVHSDAWHLASALWGKQDTGMKILHPLFWSIIS